MRVVGLAWARNRCSGGFSVFARPRSVLFGGDVAEDEQGSSPVSSARATRLDFPNRLTGRRSRKIGQMGYADLSAG